MRAIARETLERAGYGVLEAPDGRAGAARWRTRTMRPIDLLLTDVVMPGMNGRELAEALRDGAPACGCCSRQGTRTTSCWTRGRWRPGSRCWTSPSPPRRSPPRCWRCWRGRRRLRALACRGAARARSRHRGHARLVRDRTFTYYPDQGDRWARGSAAGWHDDGAGDGRGRRDARRRWSGPGCRSRCCAAWCTPSTTASRRCPPSRSSRRWGMPSFPPSRYCRASWRACSS